MNRIDFCLSCENGPVGWLGSCVGAGAAAAVLAGGGSAESLLLSSTSIGAVGGGGGGGVVPMGTSSCESVFISVSSDGPVGWLGSCVGAGAGQLLCLQVVGVLMQCHCCYRRPWELRLTDLAVAC